MQSHQCIFFFTSSAYAEIVQRDQCVCSRSGEEKLQSSDCYCLWFPVAGRCAVPEVRNYCFPYTSVPFCCAGPVWCPHTAGGGSPVARRLLYQRVKRQMPIDIYFEKLRPCRPRGTLGDRLLISKHFHIEGPVFVGPFQAGCSGFVHSGLSAHLTHFYIGFSSLCCQVPNGFPACEGLQIEFESAHLGQSLVCFRIVDVHLEAVHSFPLCAECSSAFAGWRVVNLAFFWGGWG